MRSAASGTARRTLARTATLPLWTEAIAPGSSLRVRSSASPGPSSAFAVTAVPPSMGPRSSLARAIAAAVLPKPVIAPVSSRRVGPCAARAQLRVARSSGGLSVKPRRSALTCWSPSERLASWSTPCRARRVFESRTRSALSTET